MATVIGESIKTFRTLLLFPVEMSDCFFSFPNLSSFLVQINIF